MRRVTKKKGQGFSTLALHSKCGYWVTARSIFSTNHPWLCRRQTHSAPLHRVVVTQAAARPDVKNSHVVLCRCRECWLEYAAQPLGLTVEHIAAAARNLDYGCRHVVDGREELDHAVGGRHMDDHHAVDADHVHVADGHLAGGLPVGGHFVDVRQLGIVQHLPECICSPPSRGVKSPPSRGARSPLLRRPRPPRRPRRRPVRASPSAPAGRAT